MNYFVIIILILLFLTVIGVVIWYFSNNTITITDGFDNTVINTADLMFFYADWCPHCKKAKPEWIKTKEYLDGNKINNYNIHCIEYDCSKQTSEIEELMDKYSVEGFPTIKLRINGKIITFEDLPTKDNIIIFLNNNVV